MPRQFVDITGQRFEKLVVVGLIDNTFCTVKCDCGSVKKVRINNVKKGHTRSCGCMGKANNFRHGVARDYPKIYGVWGNMIARCYRQNTKHYDNYGGRGIRVCARWHDAGLFCADMLPSWKEGLTLDRIDCDKDYSPENCRWATRVEQQNNRRTNRWVETPQGRMTVAQASRAFGITHKVISARLEAGWSDSDAVSTPIGSRHGSMRRWSSP